MKRALICLVVGIAVAQAVEANDSNIALKYLSSGQYDKALPIVAALAEKGDVVGQHYFATMYRNGDGVPRDIKKASAWYERVANSGVAHPVVADAMSQLSLLYRGELGHPKDMKRAAFWTQKAANAGDVEAMNQLGILYYDGNGVGRDYAAALNWFSKAAEQGHPEAQSFIGDLYRFGRSVKQDYSEAARWYEKAATKDYPHALFMLGVLYGQGLGVGHDRSRSDMYYQRAATQGHPQAKEFLAARTKPLIVIEGPASDPEYGYKAEKAIRTGGSAANQRAFLDQLRGPNGEPVKYDRTDSCGAYKDDTQPFGQALIDCYTVTYEGEPSPATLHLDLYKADRLWAPRGFTFANR